MLRRQFFFSLVGGLFAVASYDLEACGDKFLRVGRSARGRRYAALHPSSILVYKPVGATPKGINEFEAMLKQAGHTPRVVDRDANLIQVFAAGRYDVLIVGYSDASRVRKELMSLPTPPVILPILLDVTKAVEAEARKEFQCLIRPNAMTKHDALAEIDRAIDLTLKNASHATS